MPVITLNHANRAEVHALLALQSWSVTCLCAAWCDVCTAFRSQFDLLAARHPDVSMLWIDIEDEAEVVDAYDVENFPTLLIQRGEYTAFYGSIEADAAMAHRLVLAHTRAEANGHALEAASASTSAPTGADNAPTPSLLRQLALALAA